ncbi:lysoplasmalogenase [Luteimicrobium sp. NPDC057192]|uniref:lysoplasmalogenase n=1 Tax=Luteimicrobium sp. NPDC057192 TaxID=3346042 RepID=UPI00362D64FA
MTPAPDQHPDALHPDALRTVTPQPGVRAVGAAFARVVVPGGLYALDLAVHLVALLTHADTLAAVTQGLLMPLLAVVVLAASTRPLARVTRWALVALGLSWLGDVLPNAASGDDAFLLMVGSFLLAQAAYVTAFWPDRRRVRAVTVACYAVAFGVLVAICAPHAGSMLAPVVVYGLMLTTMAVLSSGLGPVAALGGAVFFVSDGLIALGHFAGHPTGTAGGVAVMSTYAVGQALLAAGVLHRASADDVPAARATGPRRLRARPGPVVS